MVWLRNNLLRAAAVAAMFIAAVSVPDATVETLASEVSGRRDFVTSQELTIDLEGGAEPASPASDGAAIDRPSRRAPFVGLVERLFSPGTPQAAQATPRLLGQRSMNGPWAVRRVSRISGASSAAVTVRRREVTANLGCWFELTSDWGLWDITYEARILAPDGSQLAWRTRWTSQSAAFAGGLSRQLTDPDEGTYRCKIKWWIGYDYLDEVEATRAVTYLVPSGETTLENAWSEMIPTAFKWRGQLSGGNFVGRKVQEAEGGNDVDTCHFTNSRYPQATGLTIGDPWDVGANSEYGDDTVGWLSEIVEYYRANGRAPCQCETDQIMKINRPATSWVSYKTNRLKMGFSATTVWSERDGHAVSKTW